MKDRLLTIVLSVAATYGLTTADPRSSTESANEPSVPAQADPRALQELVVDRLIVRKELIVSDTEMPWEAGFEKHQIARGIYASSLGNGTAGLWVRGRLIKGEIDDPFDDRFHALESDGSPRNGPGHISWNVWVDDAWRQVAIIQGEALEPTEVDPATWSGDNHPGRLRFQSFRPHHPEPLTDAVLGQGKLSVGGGGYGGGGLPYPSEVLELWGGNVEIHRLERPSAPQVVQHDGSGEHIYSLIAVGPQGNHSRRSISTVSGGYATLSWDSVPGADAYIVLRDGEQVSDPLRIEGSQKQWRDPLQANPPPIDDSP